MLYENITIDIFVNTKMDEGPCQKIHSEPLKAKFAKSKDLFMFDGLIEREFNVRITEVDRAIKRSRARVEEEKTDETVNPDINPDVLRVNAEISKVISSAEEAGEVEGNIDKVVELIQGKLEDLMREKTAILNRIAEIRKQRPGGPDKKLRVCDVCGSFLSIFDSDKRLTDHFMGKQHIGLQYMRDTVEAIKKRREEMREFDRTNRSRNDRSSSRDRRDNGDSSRDKDRRRTDSRDRRDRDRDSRDHRERDKYGGRDDNNRDRDRDRDRDRRRDDSRSRSDRDRGNRDRDIYGGRPSY